MTLVVTRAIGLVTVQDLGRPGRMHEALAPGGALVPEWLVAANRAVGNADDAAAIEVCGQLIVRADTDVIVAAHATATHRRAGEPFEVVSEPARVAYLAIRGGIDAPVILGSRSTQLSAGIGALVRAGDRLVGLRGSAGAGATRIDPPHAGTGRMPTAASDSVRVVAGPDTVPGALDRLLAEPYRISPNSDRVGTRLDGTALAIAAAGGPSRPMVCGAIEVPGDGMPVVLGPEHPTTGGYPVIAVIAQADLGRFFAIRLGGTVRFRRGN